MNCKSVFYRKLTRATIPKILSVSPLTNKEQVIRDDVSYIATNIFKSIRYFFKLNYSNTTSGSTDYHCNIKATSLINYLNLILNANLTSGKLSLVFF